MTVTLTNEEADLILNRVLEIDDILVMLARKEVKANGNYSCPLTDKVTRKSHEIFNLIMPKRMEEEE
tara:strand:- start:381 stop:581 length:201 start_codon:yes stop_codon:yes gene_type:complete